MLKKGKSLSLAAAQSGMDEKTARKYYRAGKLPSELKKEHTWRTRADPFSAVWSEVALMLADHPGFEAKTLFEDLQRRYPGRFQDGQLRTLQRKVKRWRATLGPPREVVFPQLHFPGRLCQSDFTHMTQLNVTVNGQPFPHLIYHFVLTYSNWETGTICFSESFENLAEGIQRALWKLGGVPRFHRTDRLSAAVHKDVNPETFTEAYKGLLNHYSMTGQHIQAAAPQENGDIEQRHYRFKRALEQALLVRGNRNFDSRKAYERYLERLFGRLNAGRSQRFEEERIELTALPKNRLDTSKRIEVRVGPSSTIRVAHRVYSVDSRLVGERIRVRLYAERLELWYGQACVEILPRLTGKKRHRIEYRHVIDSLVRKPGAFEQYRYKEDLFPTHRFRVAYDQLRKRLNGRSSKEYLLILDVAAKVSESRVDFALSELLRTGGAITVRTVQQQMASLQVKPDRRRVSIDTVDLSAYDGLLRAGRVSP